MKSNFRISMAWLHTWAGVVLGALLFVIFWMGSLAVFDREIDRWMMPMTRLHAAQRQPPASLDRDIRPILESRIDDATAWSILLPTERNPFFLLQYGDEGRKPVRLRVDPQTLQELPDAQTLGATRFIHPFHYNLTLRYQSIGAWLVGFAGMAMLCLLVSGVVIHRKIFKEFFTFRSKKNFQRSTLDLHNLTGVLVLPFHLLITLSGLLVAFALYLPFAHQALYPETAAAARPRAADADRAAPRAARAEPPQRAFLREALGQVRRPRSEAPGVLGSLDAIVARAEAIWKTQKVASVRVNAPHSARPYVVVRPSATDSVSKDIDTLTFDGGTGALIGRFDASPVVSVWNFFAGFHITPFDHWLLRWLYFAAGLSGCVMIATGYLFWLQARRASHARKGLAGVQLVEALSIGGITGPILATLAFFIANRLLPLGFEHWGLERAQWETRAFFIVWCLAIAHAAGRCAGHRGTAHKQAWREQCWAIAGMAVLACVLNGATTGDHLWTSIAHGYWPVAGMDLALLLGAALAAFTARRLGRTPIPRPAPRTPAAGQEGHAHA